METKAPPDTLVVCGDKLRQAREARGLSVHDMASVVTLSREQVRALEDGGHLPFYTAAHKRLALKKYASALAIPWSELVVDPVDPVAPAPALPAADATAGATPVAAAGSRLAAAERIAQRRRMVITAGVALALALGLYAKQRGTPDAEPPLVPVAGVAADEPVPITSGPDIDLAATARTPVQPAEADGSVAPALALPATEAVPCTLPPAGEVPVWSPPYRRKPDTRLFLVSSKPVDICIADASGKPSLIALKPNAGQVFAGKPPYLVKAEELDAIEIYLQGMRVRAPAASVALRLVPATLARPPEVAASEPDE